MTRNDCTKPLGLVNRLWTVPLFIFVVIHLIVNFLYGLYPRPLNGMRLVFAFWMILGASLSGLLWLRPERPWTHRFTISLAVLSVAAYLMPVWSGLGCWVEDCTYLAAMMACGAAASAVAASWLPLRLPGLSGKQAGTLLLIEMLALMATVAWVWPAQMFSPEIVVNAGRGTEPTIVWSRTEWTDIVSKLVPARLRGERAQPTIVAAGPDVFLVLKEPQTVEIREASSGSLLKTMTLTLPPALRSRRLGNERVWRAITVEGDLCAFESYDFATIGSLSAGREMFFIENLRPGGILLLPDGATGRYLRVGGQVRHLRRQTMDAEAAQPREVLWVA